MKYWILLPACLSTTCTVQSSPVHAHAHAHVHVDIHVQLVGPRSHIHNLSLPRGQRAPPTGVSFNLIFRQQPPPFWPCPTPISRSLSFSLCHRTHFNAFYLLCKSSSVLLPKKKKLEYNSGFVVVVIVPANKSNLWSPKRGNELLTNFAALSSELWTGSRWREMGCWEVGSNGQRQRSRAWGCDDEWHRCRVDDMSCLWSCPGRRQHIHTHIYKQKRVAPKNWAWKRQREPTRANTAPTLWHWEISQSAHKMKTRRKELEKEKLTHTHIHTVKCNLYSYNGFKHWQMFKLYNR